MSKELTKAEIIFEVNEFALMQAELIENNKAISEYSIGLKDQNGDIYKIVTLNEIINI